MSATLSSATLSSATLSSATLSSAELHPALVGIERGARSLWRRGGGDRARAAAILHAVDILQHSRNFEAQRGPSKQVSLTLTTISIRDIGDKMKV